MTKPLDVAVVESRWWKDGNTSVRGLFDYVATTKKGNPEKYHYEMFNNDLSLEEVIDRVSKKGSIRNLYIVEHGWEGGICGAEQERHNEISRKRLGTMLSDKKLSGLYLSSCLTANQDTVGFLLERSKVRWIAGYSGEVDWLEGASIDLYFWASYYRTNNSGSADDRICRVACKIRNYILPACKNYGFNIFLRSKDEAAKPLLYDL